MTAGAGRGAARAAAAFLLLFAIDAALVAGGLVPPLDAALLRHLRRAGEPGSALGPAWLLAAARHLTLLGAGPARTVVGLGGTAWLALRGRRQDARRYAAAVASAAFALPLVKPLFHRPRPPLPWHLAAEHDWSFPSGHAFGATVSYVLAGWLLGRWPGAAAGGALALAIGLTRVFLGVHWASDVAGGWLLGGAWVSAALAIGAGRATRR